VLAYYIFEYSNTYKQYSTSCFIKEHDVSLHTVYLADNSVQLSVVYTNY